MTPNTEQNIREILADPKLTYPQRIIELAKAAENTPDPLPLSEDAQWFVDQGVGRGQRALPSKVCASGL